MTTTNRPRIMLYSVIVTSLPTYPQPVLASTPDLEYALRVWEDWRELVGEGAAVSERYTVDGTENDGFTLSGDGTNAPFAVFDSVKQDWLPPFEPTREQAEARVKGLHAAEARQAEVLLVARKATEVDGL